MRYIRYALFCSVAAVAFSASPKPAQSPVYKRAEKGLVTIQPEPGREFTRLRFIADIRYFPDVKRRGNVLQITLDGGARFAPLDTGAGDKRIKALRTDPRGKILEILLNEGDTDTRVYFSETASGIDVIDCPCPGRPSYAERAGMDVDAPGIPAGSPDDESFISRQFAENLKETPIDTAAFKEPEPVILYDTPPEPVKPPPVDGAAPKRQDGVFVYEQTAFEEPPVAISSALPEEATRQYGASPPDKQSFPPVADMTSVSEAIAQAYANITQQTTDTPPSAPPAAAPDETKKPVEEKASPPEAKKKKATKAAPPTDTTALTFVWPRKPSLAFFERQGRYWLVAAAGTPLNDNTLATQAKRVFSTFETIPHPNYSIYYGRKKKDAPNVTLSSEKKDDGYHVKLRPAKTPAAPVDAIAVTTDTSKLAGSAVRIKNMPLIPPLRLFDPVIGDELLIMTGYNSHEGNPESRVFPDFSLLPSAQGMAAELRSDQVSYEFSGRDIVMAGPTNRLAASAQSALTELREEERLQELEKQASGGENDELSLLKFNSWRLGGDAQFTDNKQALMTAISEAPIGKRSEARLALARFYFAHGLEAEAGAVIGVLREHDPAFAARPEIILLAGAARYLAGDYDGANAELKDLNPKAFSDVQERDEATLWKSLANIKMYNAAQMPERFLTEAYTQQVASEKPAEDNSDDTETESSDSDYKNVNKNVMRISTLVQDNTPPPAPELSAAVDGFMSFYPIDVYNDVILSVLEYHLVRGNIVESDTVATMLKREDSRPSFINSVNIMRGISVARDGDNENALFYWKEPSEDISDPKNRALSLFLSAYLSYKERLANVDETITALNSVRTGWRGGVIELNALKTVGELYIQQGDYMRGFEAWRIAATNLTQYPAALDIASRLSEQFMRLLGRKEHPTMSQLDMLTLFYEFRELVPVGNAGDKIISTLADRLISVDLLSRASALLTHQVQYRLKGEQRDEAMFKLVDIHMRNNRHDLALEVLNTITPSGEAADETAKRVKYLSAFALIEMKRYNKALLLLREDETPQAVYLRTDIYWRNRVWRHIIAELVPIFREIRREKETFTKEEGAQMIRLAVAYALLEQRKYLQILREDFENHMQDERQRELFDFITLDRGGVNPERLDYSLEFAEINKFMKQYETITPSSAN